MLGHRAPKSTGSRVWPDLALRHRGSRAGSFSLQAVGRAGKGGLIPFLRAGRAVEEGELLVTLCQALG